MNGTEAILMNMTMDGRLPVGRCSSCRELHILGTGWELVVPHADRHGAGDCPGTGLPPGALGTEEG
jgi:hypothetical protein